MSRSRKRPARSRAPRPESRQPTYGSAARLVRMYLALASAPHGRDLDAIVDELGVSRKTGERYAKVLVDSVQGQDGLPLVEVVRVGGRPRLRVRRPKTELQSTEYQAASMFFAAAALRSLHGTVIGDGAGDVWGRFVESLPQRTREALRHIERKFAYVPFAAKSYERLDAVLGDLLKAVLRQEILDVRYRRPDGRTHHHEFQPYSFVLYRDGLYLLGKSSRHTNPVYLAIDRIRAATRTGGHFGYPADFDPLAYAEGVFGIWSGPETQVSLRLRGRAAEHVPERIIHPTQSFTPLRGGEILMRFRVRGWQELAWWILSWGADIEVEEPADLREYVRKEVRAAAARYAG